MCRKKNYYDIFRQYDYYALAKLGDKTVGFLQAFSDRDNFATSYLYAISVHKDYQRKGIGRALMTAFNKNLPIPQLGV
ncbi:GNAT family N-acetyltransferase [Campylobacter sp. RM16188]|uniref:GNAT family N-acetyltransferase n=1 Tax=Campylobacter sp. RM16188 TaxID=1705725 RepID=UPI0015538EED